MQQSIIYLKSGIKIVIDGPMPVYNDLDIASVKDALVISPLGKTKCSILAWTGAEVSCMGTINQEQEPEDLPFN
jgi:hypothetical protein